MTRHSELSARLARVESRNLAGEAEAAGLFWSRAAGSRVTDAQGRVYLDFTSAFGVAAIGHSHPALIDALHQSAQTLLAGLGDVHPNEAKVELLEALAALYPGGVPAKGVLGLSGSDAIEIAQKTARLATGRGGILAFEGAYHGLSLGALRVTHETRFSDPFDVADRAVFVPYGDLAAARRALAAGGIGLVLVEPILGRGGIVVPPDDFLPGLSAAARAAGALLCVDEVYTGCGRTGSFFACGETIPDLLCVGKALGGGVPISACLGRAEVMDAWPRAEGEAIHTQTFLGYPLGCAAALATLDVILRDDLSARARRIGEIVLRELAPATDPASEKARWILRGRGALWGLLRADNSPVLDVVARAREAGLLILPQGPRGEVLAIVPPLTISEADLIAGLRILFDSLDA